MAEQRHEEEAAARLALTRSAELLGLGEEFGPENQALPREHGSMKDELSTDHKGQIAVLKVQMEAFRKGAIVLLPTTPTRFDLGLLYEGKFYRVQVKYGDCKSQNSQGAVRVDLRRRKRCYTQDEIDVVMVYVPQIDRVCWFPPSIFHNKVGLQLRFAPARNGQRKGCLSVDDYIW